MIRSFFFILLIANSAFAQVTKVGNDTLIDIATWNTEWFGDASNGPTDENLQYANIKNIIQKTDIDVWALCEVSATNIFSSLLTDLTAYTGELSSFSQTQKTALIWKKNKFAFVSATAVSDASEPNFNYAFVSRPPLEVVLKTINSTYTDTIYFYVLHLKANTGSADQESYNRRKDASTYLKKYLTNAVRKNRKVVVLGDFNDDLDASVVKINSNYLATPLANFIADTANYFSPSLRLSILGQSSYPNFNPPNMIDHIVNSRLLSDSFYVQNSAVVLSQLSSQVAGYLNNTTDHYPVMARYNFKRYPKPADTTSSGLNDSGLHGSFSLFPNPNNGVFYINTNSQTNNSYQVNIYNSLGELVHSSNTENQTITLPVGIANGVYTVTISKMQYTSKQKLVLLR